MSRQSVFACGFWAFLVAISGCSSARYVSIEPNGGIVAIPSNTNSWPDYNRKNAEELMKEKCPQGFVIDREQEVVIGTTEHTDVNTEKTGAPLLAALKVSPVEEKRTEKTYRTDRTEWRIWFHAVDAEPVGRAPTESTAPAPVR
jgi:hypothetical protein